MAGIKQPTSRGQLCLSHWGMPCVDGAQHQLPFLRKPVLENVDINRRVVQQLGRPDRACFYKVQLRFRASSKRLVVLLRFKASGSTGTQNSSWTSELTEPRWERSHSA